MSEPDLSVLINNVEIDAQKIHEAASKDMVVVPRNGDPYNSIPKVVRMGEEKLAEVTERLNSAGSLLSTAVQQEITTKITTQTQPIKDYVEQALTAYQSGAVRVYATLAAANADIANITTINKVSVLSVADGGDYYKASANATSLTKSPYDVLALLKVYLDSSISTQANNSRQYTDQEIANITNRLWQRLNYKFDFYTYDVSLPSIIQVNESNQVIGTGTTAVTTPTTPTTVEASFLYDFYTYEVNPDILFVDGNMRTLKTEGAISLDFNKVYDDLPVTEKDAANLYFDSRSLKRGRSTYHELYYQANATAIPLNKAQVVYDFYDNLMVNNDNYITKSQVGVSTRGVPVYQYKFTPPPKRISALMNQSQVRPVRIMINAGIHGSEKNGIIAVMCLAENLVNHWREFECYDELRMHCEFVITPMMNVDGTNSITRKNANGVDVNRNFDNNWATGGSTDTTSENYRGTEPFSEVESRLYRDVVDAYPNADLYIDVHHGGEAEIMWLGSNIQANLELLTNVGTEMSTYFHKHINPTLDPQTRLLYIANNGDGTAAGYLASKGKSSVLFEGIGSDNANVKTVFNARKFNELCLLKIVYAAFNRTKFKRELLT